MLVIGGGMPGGGFVMSFTDVTAERAAIADVRKTAATAAAAAAAQLIAAHHDAKSDAVLIDQSIASLN